MALNAQVRSRNVLISKYTVFCALNLPQAMQAKVCPLRCPSESDIVKNTFL